MTLLDGMSEDQQRKHQLYLTNLLRTINGYNRCWDSGTERKVKGSFCDQWCLYKIVAVCPVSVVEIFLSGQKCRVAQPFDIFTAKAVPLPWWKVHVSQCHFPLGYIVLVHRNCSTVGFLVWENLHSSSYCNLKPHFFPLSLCGEEDTQLCKVAVQVVHLSKKTFFSHFEIKHLWEETASVEEQ